MPKKPTTTEIERPDWVTNVEAWDKADKRTKLWLVNEGPDGDDDVKEYILDEMDDETDEDGETIIHAMTETDLDSERVEDEIGKAIDDAMRQELTHGADQAKTVRAMPITMAEKHVKRLWPDMATTGMPPHSRSKKKEGSNQAYNLYDTLSFSKKYPDGKVVTKSRLDRVFDRYINPQLAKAIADIKAKPLTERKGNAKLQTHLKDLSRERTDELGWFKSSVDLVHTFAMIEEHCEHIVADYWEDWADAGKVSRSSTPIRLQRGVQKKRKDGTTYFVPTETHSFSVQSFIDLDIMKATENPDFKDPVKQLGVVMKTTFPVVQRKPAGKTEPTADSIDKNAVIISNAEQIESAWAELASRAKQASWVATTKDLLNTKNNKGEYQNNDLLASMFAVHRFLSQHIVGNAEFKKRFDAMTLGNGEQKQEAA